MFHYERDPKSIYDASFSIIEAECDLSAYSAAERSVAVRLVHSCGMTNVLKDFCFSASAVAQGITAMAEGAKIITDVQMVAHGIIRRKLPANNDVLCAIGQEGLAEHAGKIGNTRSAAAIDILKSDIPGSIIAIGNAPTALFYLLELLRSGLQPPALIIGTPVGFVGAVESKQALSQFVPTIPYITVHGRLGGSAMAASIVNALASGLNTCAG